MNRDFEIYKGYVFKIKRGNDKQRFWMKDFMQSNHKILFFIKCLSKHFKLIKSKERYLTLGNNYHRDFVNHKLINSSFGIFNKKLRKYYNN